MGHLNLSECHLPASATSSLFWTPHLEELHLGPPLNPSQNSGVAPGSLFPPTPRPFLVSKPSRFCLLCVFWSFFLDFPFVTVLAHSLTISSEVVAANPKWPLPPGFCLSPTCFPDCCQRTLSRKACSVTEFPCLKCAVCCLCSTEELSWRVHAHSFHPVSCGSSSSQATLQPLPSASVRFPTPWPLHLLFLLSGTSARPCSPFPCLNSCWSFWSQFRWQLL